MSLTSQPVQLIMSHVGTDFDGLASMVLAQKLYPGARIVFPGRMGSGVAEFYALHRRHFPAIARKAALKAEVQRLIVVDTRSASRLGAFRSLLHHPDIELHIYDHHPPSAESVKGDQEWVEAVGAAATLLVERCQARKLELTPIEATLVLIALHEETGSFRYASTTERDLSAAAFAMSQGANLEVLEQFLRDPLTAEQRALLEEYLAKGELVEGPAGPVYLCAATRDKSIYGLGLLASRMLEVEGCEAVCAILEIEGKHCSIAARSNSDAIDVSAWMAGWGGGGHSRAAAASRLELTPEDILGGLRELALSEGGKGGALTAADLMSVDIHSFEQSVTIQEAMAQLVEKGHNAACIMEEGEILGIVSRGDLSRALEHGLGHAPATSVMTHRVLRVEPGTPLDEVRRLVVERDVGTLPVLEGEQLLGMISRTDLLREMYEQQQGQRAWARGAGPGGLDLSDTPEPYRTWLQASAELAQERRLRLYAVGGFVRDKLLNRHNDDLDMVVEGDAIGLARELAERIGGKLISHEKYMTATLKFRDGHKLDIATARREVYCRPAALPDVAQSNLKSDLYRRDFTINSLALRLNPGLQGTVIDFFGGQKDLESKAIRVLHNHSFFDDPTRIVRAVRFEQRLGFSIEPHTLQLLRGAVKEKVLTLSKPERVREELRLALAEAEPIPVLRRLGKLNIIGQIHPELDFDPKVAQKIQRAMDLRKQHPELLKDDEFWWVAFSLLGLELSKDGARRLRQRFGWSLLEWPFELEDALRLLCRRPMRPSQVGQLLDKLSDLALVVFASISSHASLYERVEYYLKEVRGRPCLLTGADVMSMGVPQGPQVAHWKRVVLDAQRDGEFSDRERALLWLKEKMAESDA